jgi:hypothetical protein
MIAQSVAEIISRVRLTVEGIDRMYLNVFVPDLQYEQGIVHFFRTHRGCGGRAVRELRLGKPCCDHQRERQPQGPTRLSLPTKISKTTPCKVAWWSLAWML